MRVVVLISGRGSNLQALLEAALPVEFACVISNKADAKGLEIAAAHGVPTCVLNPRDFPDRAAFDAALAEMHRTFNCGIGMVVVVAAERADAAMQFLTAEGETVYRLGEIAARAPGQEQTVIV